MRALLIEVDFSTGRRAGAIDPRDKHLLCHGWQNLDEGLEIRIIDDGRDLKLYEGVKGVTILEGKDAINAAIEEHIPTKYQIQSEYLMRESLSEAGFKLSIFAGKDTNEMAKEAYELGLLGVVERKAKLLE